MKEKIQDLERRVTALEKAQGASAASQMGKLSRKHPTEAQRAASRANGDKGGRPKGSHVLVYRKAPDFEEKMAALQEARRKKPNDTEI